MTELITSSNITFVLGLFGVLFTVYNYFRNPQIEAEKTDGILTLKLTKLQDDFVNLRDNHVHSLDQKVDETNKNLGVLTTEVTRLGTIIEERIPKKKK